MPFPAPPETGRINLRDVPTAVIRHYKAKAKASGQSLNAFLVRHLEHAMATERSEWQRFLDAHTRGDVPSGDGRAAFDALDRTREAFGRFEDGSA